VKRGTIERKKKIRDKKEKKDITPSVPNIKCFMPSMLHIYLDVF
jgi:hypothetical protein